jgi:membrane protease YdiL (CAAX protease family)
VDSLIVFLVSGPILGSCYVWWRIAHRWRRGEAPLPFRERSPGGPHPAVVAISLVLWIAIQYAAGRAMKVEPDPEQFSLRHVQASCLANVLILTIVPVLLTFGGRISLARFGLYAAKWKEQIGYGAVGFLGSVAPVYVVLFTTLPLRTEKAKHDFLQLLAQHPGLTTAFWITVAAVVTAPLAEELIFRAVLQGGLQDYLSPSAAIAVTAAIFSVIHSFPDSLPLFPLALVLGYVYYRLHSYLAVVVLHALFNGWNLLLALLTT